MACAADIHGLTALDHRRRWFRSLRVWILFSPFQVAFERAMASFAANPHFGHSGVVGVIGRIVVFEEPRVVAIGAAGVPVHAASGPMAIFIWLTVLGTIHVKPILRYWVVSKFMHLPAATRSQSQQLSKGSMSDDALNLIRFNVTVEAQGNNLETPVLDVDLAGL